MASEYDTSLAFEVPLSKDYRDKLDRLNMDAQFVEFKGLQVCKVTNRTAAEFYLYVSSSKDLRLVIDAMGIALNMKKQGVVE